MGVRLLLADENNLIPFHFNSTDKNVFSVYEAMYHTVNFMGECLFEVLSDEFIAWLEKADSAFKRRSFESKTDYIISVFKSYSYFDTQELEEIEKNLAEKESAGKFAEFKEKGDVYYKKGDYINSCSMYFSAFNIEETAEVLNNIGLCFIALDDLKTGMKCIEQAALMTPENESISYNLAKAYVLCGEYIKALNVLKNKEDFESMFLKAEINISVGEIEKAADILNVLYKQNPDDKIIFLLCSVYTEQKNFEKAEEIISMAKESYERAIAVSSIYAQKRDYKNAIREIEKNLMKYRDNQHLWLALSEYYRLSGDYVKAEGAVYKAYTLDRENIEILLEHAKIKYSSMKYPEYKSRINEILKKLKKKYRENEKFLIENI